MALVAHGHGMYTSNVYCECERSAGRKTPEVLTSAHGSVSV